MHAYKRTDLAPYVDTFAQSLITQKATADSAHDEIQAWIADSDNAEKMIACLFEKNAKGYYEMRRQMMRNDGASLPDCIPEQYVAIEEAPKLEYPVHRLGYDRRINGVAGFVDVYIKANVARIGCSNGSNDKYFGKADHYFQTLNIFVEVKSSITSPMEVIKQINYYKSFLSRGEFYSQDMVFVVACPDATHRKILESQGIVFFGPGSEI